MKMKLEIRAETQDEVVELRKHLDGPTAFAVLRELDNKLRNMVKYREDLEELYKSGLQHARDLLWETVNDYELEVE